jgi:hypothetical protein
MAQPASILYTVLPVDQKSGMSIIAYCTFDIIQAQLEASRLTVLNSKQYVVLTATHYTDVLTTSSSAIPELVKPIV